MKEYEKKIKQEFRNNFLNDSKPNLELYQKVTKDMKLEKKDHKFFSFRKWVPTVVVSLCLIVAIVLGFVFTDNKNVETYNSIVQLDVNPSIQLVVNQDNKVLSISGLNDEGKMVICDEMIIDKNFDEAVELIIDLEVQMGYLTAGSNNKVTITVSAENENIVQEIQNKSEEYINDALEESGIIATIEKVKGYTIEELKDLVKKLDPTLTEEQINSFNYNQLVNVVKVYHIETIEFASVKLEEFYKNYKEYEISFSEKEAVKKAVEQLDDFYQISFNYAYENLIKAYDLLQQTYYETFINSESEYQKKWLELAELKRQYLVQKVKVENMPENATEKEIQEETFKLNSLEFTYRTAETILNEIEEKQTEVYEYLCNSFDVAFQALESIEANLPDSVKEITFEKIYETEEAINRFKNELCNNFETAYADDIELAKQAMKNRKEELISSYKGNN